MTTKLPQVNEAAPRRRAATTKKPAARTPTAKKKTTREARDIELNDQAARAELARAAAMSMVQPAQDELPPVAPAPQVGEPTPEAVAVPVPEVPAAPAFDAKQLIVNQDLVEVLKSVKSTSLADFELFLQELHPLMELWSSALSEQAARRHALSIMLLIKERF